jgi:hypothetical protein
VPPDLPSLTRRTALGAALVGLVTISGCDLDDLDPRSDPASPDAPAASAPPVDADTTLVAGVVGALSETLAAATAVRRRDRAAFRPLAQLHRRHLRELDGEPSAAVGGRVAPAALVGQEQQLQQSLAAAALAAESGELARVLASMSAAVAQQLAVLPAVDA